MPVITFGYLDPVGVYDWLYKLGVRVPASALLGSELLSISLPRKMLQRSVLRSLTTTAHHCSAFECGFDKVSTMRCGLLLVAQASPN